MQIKIKKFYESDYFLTGLLFCAFMALDMVPMTVKGARLFQTIALRQDAEKSTPAIIKSGIRDKLLAERQKLENGLGAMKTIVSAAEQKISEERNIPNITLKLEELANTAGVELLSIKPSATEEKEKDDYESVTILLEMECEFPQLVAYLSSWQGTAYYMIIQEMTTTLVKENFSKVHTTMKMNVLFRNKKEAPPLS